MGNKFFQIKNKKKNQEFLKENGFKKLKSAIFNPERSEILLINVVDKEFWTTCQDGILDASKTIKEVYNESIQIINKIESCLQN